MRKLNHAVAASRRFAAFTLVELLVVIGIIAVLIGILLPALNKARQQANIVKCASNLRSIGQGLYLYAASSHDSLPFGYYGGGNTTYFDYPSNGLYASDWTTQVAHVLNANIPTDYYTLFANNLGYSPAGAGSRGIFLCPAVSYPIGSKSLLDHYSCHPRLMPNIPQTDPYGSQLNSGPASTTWRMRPYKISQVRRASEIALVFDGSLYQNQGGNNQWNAGDVGNQLDQGLVNYPGSTGMTDNYNLTPRYFDTNGGQSISLQPNNSAMPGWNSDVQNNIGNIRFRHATNNKANVLFVDGHVATYTLQHCTDASHANATTDLLRKNVNVNYAGNDVNY